MQITRNKTFKNFLFYAALFGLVGMWLIITVPSARAGTAESQGTPAACHKFVQQFYDWYISGPQPKGNQSKTGFALKEKSSSFSTILKQRLQEDEAASAKVKDEIVGLDFDPFLNSQSTPERFIVGTVTPKGASYFVDVYGVFDGKKSGKPDVTPELVLQKGQWVFTNFHYPSSDTPENKDLISVLKSLAADRAKHPN